MGLVHEAARPDGVEDLTDAMAILMHLFGGQPIPCRQSADANGDGKIDLLDPLGLLAFLYLDGSPPTAPFPACGTGADPTGLGCEEYAACRQNR